MSRYLPDTDYSEMQGQCRLRRLTKARRDRRLESIAQAQHTLAEVSADKPIIRQVYLITQRRKKQKKLLEKHKI